MDERIGLFDALYTSRAIRRFRSDPVPDTVISKLIESAAPNGSNRQRWRFVAIRDPDLRRRVGEIYRRAMDELIPPEDVAKDIELVGDRLFQASRYLAEHIGVEPPVLILVCQEGSSPPTRQVDALLAARSRGASVYPAVQNLLLAARAHGLGGCLTTTHVIHEEEIKTILGIPEQVNTFALVPLGYPQDHFGPVRRRPVGDVTYLDRWGTPFSVPQRVDDGSARGRRTEGQGHYGR